jgi:hypothetical protein
MGIEKNKFEQYYKAREIIKDIVRKDLFGPVLEDEVIIELPAQYYAMGKLYPKEQEQDILDMARSTGIDSDLESYDASLASTNIRNPSSMGITCTLKKDVSNINVSVDFGMYESMNFQEVQEKEINVERWSKDIKEDTMFWSRRSFSFNHNFELGDLQEVELLPAIILRGYVHKICRDGERIFTLVLINGRETGNDRTVINANMIFQPHIRISSANEEKKIFTSTIRQVEIKEDFELLEMDMLYSQYKCYGQGHGCSVNWGNEGEKETEEPEFVESSFIPEYNLKQMKAVQIDDLPVLSMEYIISIDASKVITELSYFVKKYKLWIDDEKIKVVTVEDRLRECAEEHIDNCHFAYNRIKNAVKVLEDSLNSDRIVWNAFVYANEAMLMQRVQTLKKQNKKVNSKEIKWYPFQLAFFLQELTSMAVPTSDDRKLVDLLWFPTGGGKTEAYLGIAAFTIFFRRMKYGETGEGVSIIMRYTLRLLTIQQFERASMLICACELLRKKYNISEKAIEIGLWVGNELTPKNIDDAEKSLRKLRVGAKLSADEADPCQIKICPWCGTEFTVENYSTDKANSKMNIQCHNNDCKCHDMEGLPIRLLDQEIYERTPAFLVATVDKFAQITLKSEPAAIFGVGSSCNPPDLIIQDELHLISGPLGTMTGIYEAAITRVCEKNNIPVKIVASTATIRNAENQIRALYGRNFTQFPPQGVSIDNSFFAVKSEDTDRPARLYLGYMGVGTTFTTTLIRIYSSWLFASRYLIDLGFDENVIDNFWTLTGYFNSLRELGGTRTQVVDDIQSRYQHLKDRKFAHLIPKFTGKNNYEFSEELTSRMGNDKISDIIQKGLKKPYTKLNSEDVYDFILASNMISVGVDVGRLGTMAVAGQPKTNAEYIQATSRVGRDNPGLVFMVYNSSRSRDRSHYEQFLRYHSALYRYVEATSLTPFSDRARDRGLQALFVTLCRYLIDNLRENSSAGNFNKDNKEIVMIERIIKEYVVKVDESELDDVLEELRDIEEAWHDKTGGELYYKKKNKNELLKPDTDEYSRFRTMNSMRSVEQQSGIYLLGG